MPVMPRPPIGGQPTSSAQPPLSQLHNPAYGDITIGPNGAAIRTVDPNETTSAQLAALESSSSPLMQLALAQGANAAAATGNVNGTLMSGASENAMLQQLTPIAAQNAQVYERAAQANEDAINQQKSIQEQVAGQKAVAGISAGASENVAKIQQQTQEKAQELQQQEFTAAQSQQLGEFNTNWDKTMAQTQEAQAWTGQNEATQNEFALKGQVVNGVINTIFSDPSYWNDPAGALGMMNDYTSNMSAIIDQLFPPGTYGQTPTQPSAGVPQVGP